MLSRRQFAGVMAATIGLGASASAQGNPQGNPQGNLQDNQPAGEDVRFVPGGRIGFKLSAQLRPHANRWHLLVPDQTFEVFVSERLRLGRDWDGFIWEQDGRHALIASDRIAGGVERRRFRDQRFGNSIDFAAEVYAFRDADWLGQIRLSTRVLSAIAAPKSPASGGQVARWRGTMEEIVGSVAIRPALTVPAALAEFQLDLTVDGLYPRLSGPHLFLSVEPPRTALAQIGFETSHILLSDLAILPLARSGDMAQANNEYFGKLRDMPGSRVVLGRSCRAVVRAETPPASSNSPAFVSYADAFGRSRSLHLTAVYGAADRGRILQALDQVLMSLSLPDPA